MILYRQGYYQEMPHAESTDPSMKDYIGKKIHHKKEICEYLQSGVVLAACGQVAYDVLNPTNGIIGTPDDVTDGKWIWPSDLAYYVAQYDLQLEEEFVKYMEQNNWRIPTDIRIDEALEVQNMSNK